MIQPQDSLSRVTLYFRLTLVTLCAFAGCFFAYVWSEKQIDRANMDCIRSLKLEQELRQSSDDLTRMVRTYVVTGDAVYKQHFQEILAIRDGKRGRPLRYENIYWDLVIDDLKRPSATGPAVSLIDRMHEAGYTQQEFNKLAEAKYKSDALTNLEFAAMTLTETDPSSVSKRQQAILMVHNQSYHQAKAAIMQPISEFIELVEQRTSQQIYATELTALLLRYLFVVLGLLLGWFIWCIRRNMHAVLGGSVTEVHAHMAKIDKGGFLTPTAALAGSEKSVINLLTETKNQLHSNQTQRQLAEQALRVSEERFHLAFAGSNDGLWDRYNGQDDVYYSPRWKSMLGYAEHELANTYATWRSHIHPEDLESVIKKIDTSMHGNADRFQHEYRMRTKNGQYLWVLNRGMIVRNAQGQASRLIGIQSDISEQKYVETMKNDFISTVSHELRTPLTSIHGALYLLDAGVMGELPPKALDLIKMAGKNSQRLIDLINQILDMEKLMSGAMMFQSEEIDALAALEQAVTINTSFASSFGVRLLNQTPDAKCIVIGDADRIVQIISNLLSNAVKFSHTGGLVTLRLIAANGFACIEVEDTGVGIPLAFRNKLFGEFSQANSSNTRQQGGTGLGLTIAKKMVTKMGGEIGYVSEIDKGSTFWFTVPLKPQTDQGVLT